MYSVHDWADVHRLHREGLPQAQIARRLGMSRNTVARLLGLPEPPTYRRATQPSLLDPFKDAVAAMLDEDAKVPSTVVLEHLRRGPTMSRAGHAQPADGFSDPYRAVMGAGPLLGCGSLPACRLCDPRSACCRNRAPVSNDLAGWGPYRGGLQLGPTDRAEIPTLVSALPARLAESRLASRLGPWGVIPGRHGTVTVHPTGPNSFCIRTPATGPAAGVRDVPGPGRSADLCGPPPAGLRRGTAFSSFSSSARQRSSSER